MTTPSCTYRLHVWVLSIILSACQAREDEIRIGVMLDYTGVAGAAGFNLEHAAVIAMQQVRAGRDGEPSLKLEFRDAKGDPDRAMTLAQELIDEGVVAVIGPSGDELVSAVAVPLREAAVPLFSPTATTAINVTDPASPWYRLGPPTDLLGRNLAKAVLDAGVVKIALVAATDVYHDRLSLAFTTEYRRLGGTVVFELRVSPDTPGDRAAPSVVSAYRDGAESVVVALNALPAAQLITEVTSSQVRPQWFLTPRVKSRLFLVNTPASAIEGAIGISPDISDVYGPDFVDEFRSRWDGEEALEDAYFMFDTCALVTLSLDRVLRAGGEITRDAVSAALLESIDIGGVQTEWNELARGIERNRDGIDIQFSGVTGPLLFAPDGQRAARTRAWTIISGEIQNLL
jgi:ABC-type branched-subunit amino acid transport system substrate-binding protein